MSCEITDLIREARRGGASAGNRLFERVYEDLRRCARHRLRASGRAGLDTTELVHETYMRVIGRADLDFADRRTFYAYVARAMRSVLIDHVRQLGARKRGGDCDMMLLTTNAQREASESESLSCLHTALGTLERIAPESHRLVELRYFAGLSVPELAELDGTSERTVQRDWLKARVLLRRLIEEQRAEVE